ncbi:MAG: hypothetical protein K5629_01625 [Eubacteriales bacterium]|nr:hypothetical protein [Eubacteriales bacterium]
MMKKRNFYIVLVIVAVLALSVFIYSQKPKVKNEFIHKTFNGIILSYEEVEKGVLIIFDDYGTTSHKRFLIRDTTMFPDDSLKQRIINREEGLHVTIESEFWTLKVKDIYPATMITPIANENE